MEIVHFSSQEEFRRWLAKNHATASELYVGFYKKSCGKKGATYSGVLDETLCFGWIDGVRRSVNSESYMIRFTPRKPNSIWSLVNVRRAEVLQNGGKMAEPGLKAFAAREAQRTVIYWFEQKRPGLDRKYKKLFRANTRAWEFFVRQAPWYQRTAGFLGQQRQLFAAIVQIFYARALSIISFQISLDFRISSINSRAAPLPPCRSVV
jgi:uncharacterized protein YdeI (YjbR/CyaY-like superfamily)